MNKLEDKIKEKIKGKKPRSKEIFVVSSIVKEVITALIWIITVLLLGAVIYLIQSTPFRVFTMPRFIFPAIIGLPWELIILAIVLIIILYLILKTISTFYRNKSILILILIISLVIGYFSAEAIGLNKIISETETIRPLYQRQGRLVAPNRGPAVVGEIIDIKNMEKFTLQDLAKTKWQVLVSKETEIMTSIEKGQFVSVIGDKHNNEIRALIIRPIKGKNCGFGCQRNNGVRDRIHSMY